MTPFGFLSVLPLKNVALCKKGIAKMHSVREFSLLMRSPLFALPLRIPTPIQTNIGSSFGLSTVFNTVLVIGMTKSLQSFAPLAYPLPLKILVATLGLSNIQRPHLVPICLVHSPLVSTSTISSISPKTLLSKSFSVVFWPNVAKSTLWALLNSFRSPFLLAYYFLFCRSLSQSVSVCPCGCLRYSHQLLFPIFDGPCIILYISPMQFRMPASLGSSWLCTMSSYIVTLVVLLVIAAIYLCQQSSHFIFPAGLIWFWSRVSPLENPLSFRLVLFAGRKHGGCWSVLGP